MKKFTIKFLVFIIILKTSEATFDSTKICAKIKETLKNCDSQGDYMHFTQNGSVLFERNFYGELKISCFATSSVNLDKIPKVNLNVVKKLSLVECSLSNELLLTRLKESFYISRLDKLIVDNNRASNYKLSKTLFEKFYYLKHLEMTLKHINFDSGAFRPLQKLFSMKLMIYDFAALPYNLFSPLEELEELELNISNRSNLVKAETRALNFTLKTCVNLRIFRLKGIKTPITIGKLLNNNCRLEKVEIIKNKIVLISENVFEGSKNIEEISLAKNGIKRLPARIFEMQTELEKLDLSHNELTELDDSIFRNNTAIETIILSHNKLSSTSR